MFQAIILSGHKEIALINLNWFSSYIDKYNCNVHHLDLDFFSIEKFKSAHYLLIKN